MARGLKEHKGRKEKTKQEKLNMPSMDDEHRVAGSNTRSPVFLLSRVSWF